MTNNPRFRGCIFRAVALLIIVAGFKVGVDYTKNRKAPDAEYLTQMQALSDRFASLEKEGQQTLTTSGKDPQVLLDSLAKIQAKKEEYIRDLQALDPPDKYKEFQQTLIEWRVKEHLNEQQLLEGFVQYSKDRSEKTSSKIDDLTKANEDIGKTFEEKTRAIAKKYGFDSVEKFLRQKDP